MNIGIICDLTFVSSICFSNYYYAIKNLFPNVKLINGVADLDGIDVVFIGNDHFQGHYKIWSDFDFIKTCNYKHIKVCVYTAECIYSKIHIHNGEMQKRLELFDHLYQRVIDVNDSIKLNKKIARGLCSYYYKDYINIPTEKLNKCVFMGKLYPDRQEVISKLQNVIEIDVIQHGILNWQDYMTKMAEYRFVLSPYSNDANTFHLKFYEALLVDSIPIHQIYDNTLDYFPNEAKFDDVIYFKDAYEIPDKIKACKLDRSHNKHWLEYELQEFFIENKII